jgi:hypothetical protein
VGFVTIFYCLRFETSLLVASYDSQGYGGGIRPRLHTGLPIMASVALLLTPLDGPNGKLHFQQYLCCVRIRCRGNVFTELSPRNGCTRYNIYSVPSDERKGRNEALQRFKQRKGAARQSATLCSLRTLRTLCTLCSLHRVATQRAMVGTKLLSLESEFSAHARPARRFKNIAENQTLCDAANIANIE